MIKTWPCHFSELCGNSESCWAHAEPFLTETQLKVCFSFALCAIIGEIIYVSTKGVKIITGEESCSEFGKRVSKLWLYRPGSTKARFCSVFTSKNTRSSYISEWEHTDGYMGKTKKETGF